MRSLIITVAGMAKRFNRDTRDQVLKCLYYEDTPGNSLLSIQIRKAYGFVDEIIVVGGYLYSDLEKFVQEQLEDPDHKVRLVYNEHFQDYGSGYSLLLGIEAASGSAREITFIEGDLFFDTCSAERIFRSSRDVISVNNEPILANKAVALYFDAEGHPRYIYDTGHSCLEIKELFTAIYNSGQMWKFTQPDRVREVCRSLTQKQKEGTNLEIIQGYFGHKTGTEIDIIRIEQWYNCNTVADYREAIKAIGK